MGYFSYVRPADYFRASWMPRFSHHLMGKGGQRKMSAGNTPYRIMGKLTPMWGRFREKQFNRFSQEVHEIKSVFRITSAVKPERIFSLYD